MVLQALLHMIQKLEYIDAVQTRVEQCVHALEGSLAQVQAVVHGVLEGAHLNLADQLPAYLRLVVQEADERRAGGDLHRLAASGSRDV